VTSHLIGPASTCAPYGTIGNLHDLHLAPGRLAARRLRLSATAVTATPPPAPTMPVTVDWLEQYSCHHLRCLSNDSSDHAPLLLVLNSEPWASPRFRFDDYWTKIDGCR